MTLSLKKRRLILLLAFLWMVGLLFVPIRVDIITGHYTGNSPETAQFHPAYELYVSSIVHHFYGHPAGIMGLIFFSLMPFFIVAESFSMKRPFTLGARAFLLLQALLLFLGGPYCYYIITYQYGYFYDTEHSTTMAWGGWILTMQNIVLAGFVFSAVANPRGKTGQFFLQRT